MCLCVQIQLTARLNNPSQRRRGFEQVRDEQNITVSSSEKLGKNHPVVPPLDHFQGENINCSSLAITISTSRGSFFANLTTFEWCSGLKFFSLFIGPEEMPILVWGRRKRPPTKM